MRVPVNSTPQGQGQDMPSEANLLMALAEMQKQGRFKVAGDVVDHPFLNPTPGKEDWQRIGNTMSPNAQGLQGSNPDAVVKGVMSGKVKVLRPEGK